jgi:hypothetical protein
MSEEDNTAFEQGMLKSLGIEQPKEADVKEEEVVEEAKPVEEPTTETVKEEAAEVAVKEEDDTTTEEETPEVEYSDLEQEALKLGWKPEGVPGRKTKSAEEWMDDYSLYKKINDLGKQVQEKNSLLENVAKHFESVQEAAYNQAKKEFDQQVSELRTLAADAIDDGTYSAEDVIAAYENDLKEITEKHEATLDKYKTQESVEPQQPTKDDIMKDLSAAEKTFINKYEKTLFSQKPEDLAVQAYVVNRNTELANENLSAEDRITALERDLVKVFPTQFGTTKKLKTKTAAAKVESATIANKPTEGLSKNSLTADQRELYDYFVEQGVPAEELMAQFEMVLENE